MAAVSLNGIAFTGLPNGSGNQSGWQPTSYQEILERVAVTLVAANGTRNRVERGVIKRQWVLKWEPCNLATSTTLRTLMSVTTTWTFTDFVSGGYSVQTEEPLEVEWAYNDRAGSTFMNVSLKLFEH